MSSDTRGDNMTDDNLSRMEREWLVELRSTERMGFAGMSSSRLFRKAPAERLLGRKLVTKLSLVLCDDDGFTSDPERWRIGYVLTEAGRKKSEALEEAQVLEEAQALEEALESGTP